MTAIGDETEISSPCRVNEQDVAFSTGRFVSNAVGVAIREWSVWVEANFRCSAVADKLALTSKWLRRPPSDCLRKGSTFLQEWSEARLGSVWRVVTGRASWLIQWCIHLFVRKWKCEEQQIAGGWALIFTCLRSLMHRTMWYTVGHLSWLISRYELVEIAVVEIGIRSRGIGGVTDGDLSTVQISQGLAINEYPVVFKNDKSSAIPSSSVTHRWQYVFLCFRQKALARLWTTDSCWWKTKQEAGFVTFVGTRHCPCVLFIRENSLSRGCSIYETMGWSSGSHHYSAAVSRVVKYSELQKKNSRGVYREYGALLG